MIVADQPTCFPPEVLVAVSSRDDGTMLDRRTENFFTTEQLERRRLFCEQAGTRYEDMVYQIIRYGDEYTYNVLREVDSTSQTGYAPGIQADALFTKEAGVGLFLPVADCVATVVYDPRQQFLALLHLGRHATLSDLVARTVEYFVQAGSDPQNLIVWMSPSAQKQSYHLQWFDAAEDPRWTGFCWRKADGIYLDMQGYNRERWIESGVQPENITVSTVDTVTSPDYFSHSTGETSGRIAVLAQMR